MKLLDIDSPLMQGLSKMADLMILNLIALVCCLPIITVGASMTAMHYMALKIVRNEECYIVRGFFKSFKQNLKQGIAIWLIQLVAIAILAGDYYLMFKAPDMFPFAVHVVVFVVLVVVVLTSVFVYPVLAKFDNTVMRTIKNSLFIGMLQFPKAILIIFINILPFVAAFIAPAIIPLVFLFGLSLPAFVAALLYNKYFQKLEDRMTGASEEGEGESAEKITEEVSEGVSEDTSEDGTDMKMLESNDSDTEEQK